MKIKIAIADERISEECRKSLDVLGFRLITLPPDRRLSEAVASHTDMLICRLGNELIATAEYAEREPVPFSDIWELCRREGIRMSFTEDEIRRDYPLDCRLNALSMGRYLFCKADSVSSFLIERAEAMGLETVSVRQGYPACTVLKLDGTHAITADRGMSAALCERGITVTEIEAGSIALPPHPYGFIGGCAGVYGGVVYFLGDPRRHPSFAEIDRAICEAGMSWRALSGDILTDLGGILFIDGRLE